MKESKLSRIVRGVKRFLSNANETKVTEFRGLDIGCSPSELMIAYEQYPVEDEEKKSLLYFGVHKDDIFFYKLLGYNEELALDIMQDCINLHRLIRIHKCWVEKNRECYGMFEHTKRTEMCLDKINTSLITLTSAVYKNKSGWHDGEPSESGVYIAKCVEDGRLIQHEARYSKDLNKWILLDNEPCLVVVWKHPADEN